MSLFIKNRNFKQAVLGFIFLIILGLGWLYPVIGFCMPFCMAFAILISLKNGRKWCDWYCPRGSFLDFYLKKVSRNKEVPEIFRTYLFRFIFMGFLFVNLGFQIYANGFTISGIGHAFIVLVSITTLVSLLFAVMWNPRAWCFLCPIGTIGSVNIKKRNVNVKKDDCRQCGICNNSCPMQLDIYGDGKKDAFHKDCLRCGICISVCQYNALYK